MPMKFTVIPTKPGYVFFGEARTGKTYLANILGDNNSKPFTHCDNLKELKAYMDLDQQDIIFTTNNKDHAYEAITMMGGALD